MTKQQAHEAIKLNYYFDQLGDPIEPKHKRKKKSELTKPSLASCGSMSKYRKEIRAFYKNR